MDETLKACLQPRARVLPQGDCSGRCVFVWGYLPCRSDAEMMVCSDEWALAGLNPPAAEAKWSWTQSFSHYLSSDEQAILYVCCRLRCCVPAGLQMTASIKTSPSSSMSQNCHCLWFYFALNSHRCVLKAESKRNNSVCCHTSSDFVAYYRGWGFTEDSNAAQV